MTAFSTSVLPGIALGLILALLIGPVFFMLINTSIKRGFVPAVFVALGVMASDGVYILISFFSNVAMSYIQMHQKWIGTAGGVVLIIFGVMNFIKKPVVNDTDKNIPPESASWWVDMVKGFSLNMLNPFVLIFWIGVAGTLSVKSGSDAPQPVLFFGSTLATVLGTDLLKAWLASRLKRWLTPALLIWLNRISGAGLIFFGAKMLVKLWISG